MTAGGVPTQDLPRPEVTLVRSSAPLPSPPRPPAEPRRRAWLLMGLTGFGLLLAGTSAGEAPPLAPAPLQGELVVVAQDLSLSQGGVLVLPMELRNGPDPVDVTRAQVYAEPVSADAMVQAPTRLTAGESRRFVAVVTPDCRLLQPGSPIEFRATVGLRLSRGAQVRDVVADLAAAAGVRQLVTGLCAGR